jgi:hypothetical protein
MTNHPITPPPELYKQWEHLPRSLAFEAAYRAGADQELEACCEWLLCNLPGNYAGYVGHLRAARRPKPSSLKEQALLAIDTAVADDRLSAVVADVVRRALEAQ